MAIDDNTSYELTGYQVKDLAQKIRAKADAAAISAVGYSNLYSDLTGAPTIPTVYNGTLTITQGGNTLGTFTANSSTNETIDIPAGGPSYTAGTGIDITNDTISIDHSVVAELSDIPTQTSDLTNDGADGTSTYVEADELATVATSGSFNDLIDQPTIPAAQVSSDWNASSGVAQILNKPTIPTVNNATLTVTQNGTSAGTFTANASSDVTIALTDTTYSAFTGASSSTAGTSGLVPAPAAGDEAKVLSGAGTWVNQSGGGASTVIYYANSTSTAGFQSGTINGPYIYKDSARTTIATPGEIYNNFQAGNPIHIEYESTGTGTSAFAMTLEVTTMSLNGSGTYSMVVNEVNEENPGDSRDLVMLRLYAYWDGQSTFSSRWTQQRKYVHNGTLTIQHNGSNVQTFSANQSTNATANIETIYSVDVSSTQPIDWTTILNKFHPVGSIYMSATLSTAAQVEAAIGGTWVAWGAGRVPVGVDTSQTEFETVEKTGGSKYMQEHYHEAINYVQGYSGGSQSSFLTILSASSHSGNAKAVMSAGAGDSENLQPYITCYMYKRTA